jgi:hypothetical protein
VIGIAGREVHVLDRAAVPQVDALRPAAVRELVLE